MRLSVRACCRTLQKVYLRTTQKSPLAAAGRISRTKIPHPPPVYASVVNCYFAMFLTTCQCETKFDNEMKGEGLDLQSKPMGCIAWG